MSDAAVVALIAAGCALTSFLLTHLFVVRPLRRWLSPSSGAALSHVVDESLPEMDRRFDAIDQLLDRIEWQARLLKRELRRSN
jgi:hypothetical protein